MTRPSHKQAAPVELAGYRKGDHTIKLLQLGRRYTVVHVGAGVEISVSYKGRRAKDKALDHFNVACSDSDQINREQDNGPVLEAILTSIDTTLPSILPHNPDHAAELLERSQKAETHQHEGYRTFSGMLEGEPWRVWMELPSTKDMRNDPSLKHSTLDECVGK